MSANEHNTLIELSEKIDLVLAQMQALTNCDQAEFLRHDGVSRSQALLDLIQSILDSGEHLGALGECSEADRQAHLDNLFRIQEAVAGTQQYLSLCRDLLKTELAATRSAMTWSSAVKDMNS